MFGHRFYGARMFGPRYWGDGGDVAVVVIAETPSGGWARREESDTERRARIKAERIRLGILPAEPSEPSEATAVEAAGAAIGGVPATLLLPDPGLAVDLAEVYAGAWLDQEIKRHFELQDDDDAAVLLLAIAAAD